MQNEEINTETSPVESVAPTTETPSVTPSTETSSQQTSGEQSKETLLDAVLKVTEVTPEPSIEDETKEEGAPPSEADSEAKAKDEKQEDDNEPVPDEEPSSDVPASTRKKINKLLRERRQLREEVQTLRDMQPAAEIGIQLHNFQQANNLSTDGIMDALDLLVMVNRGDYAGFYEKVGPLVRHAQEVLGIVLPPDVQQLVDQGQMTEQAARQYSTTRFERANYEVKARQMAARQEDAMVHQVRDNVQRSVTAFEQRLAATDPDYKAKAESVRRTAQALLLERGGQINSVDDALSITKQAYDEVSAQFRRLQPQARATAAMPGRSNPQTPAARPQPKSMLDAIKGALAR